MLHDGVADSILTLGQYARGCGADERRDHVGGDAVIDHLDLGDRRRGSIRYHRRNLSRRYVVKGSGNIVDQHLDAAKSAGEGRGGLDYGARGQTGAGEYDQLSARQLRREWSETRGVSYAGRIEEHSRTAKGRRTHRHVDPQEGTHTESDTYGAILRERVLDGAVGVLTSGAGGVSVAVGVVLTAHAEHILEPLVPYNRSGTGRTQRPVVASDNGEPCGIQLRRVFGQAGLVIRGLASKARGGSLANSHEH